MSASERLKALDAAATPVGWFNDTHWPEGVYNGCPTSHWDYYLDQADAALIVALRNALPQIVAVVERDERLIMLAEHLWQMIPQEVWREHGAEWMGQYEGDHHAEQVRGELVAHRAALAALEEALQ